MTSEIRGICCGRGSAFILGRGAGVDVEVTLEVETGSAVPSLALLLLLELFDEVLALPGEVAGGVLSTREWISTVAVVTG